MGHRGAGGGSSKFNPPSPPPHSKPAKRKAADGVKGPSEAAMEWDETQLNAKLKKTEQSTSEACATGHTGLRNYQHELAEQALEGHNSMIIAPTGSGKTMVAKEIIKKRLDEEGSKCILFFVTKTTLALQQCLFLKRHLGCPVQKLIGQNLNRPDSLKLIKMNRVTVLTPQILINALESKNPYISFTDIALMVFDECHNMVGRHPYKIIMDKLMESEESTRVQIVGLTASPGIGKAVEKNRVVGNLLGLLAVMNIKLKPSVVVKYQHELKIHQNEIKEDFRRVKTEDDLFTQKLKETMKELEEGMKNELSNYRDYKISEPPGEKNIPAYGNWVNEVKRYAEQEIHDALLKIVVKTYTKHLNMYHVLSLLKNLVGNAMEYTDELVDFTQEEELSLKLKEKHAVLKKMAEDVEVPMMKALFGILKDAFDENPNGRCIIFIERKDAAVCLVKSFELNAKLKELNPRCLMGSKATAAGIGMSWAEQKRTLIDFRTGHCKVLIATSIGEEGLDIPACNLVIMYNYVTGEVGRIQRAGRGRAQKSRSILMAAADGDHFERERLNRIYSEASEEAVKEVRNMPKTQLCEKILQVQQEQRRHRRQQELVAKEKQERRANNSASEWTISCKCEVFMTTGDKLRHIDNIHTVIKDPGFETLVRKQICNKKRPGINITAEFYCSKCEEKIASQLQHKNCSYPALSLKKLLWKTRAGEVAIVKGSKDLPFTVEKEVTDPDEEGIVAGVGAQNDDYEDCPAEGLESIELFDNEDLTEMLACLSLEG